MIRKERVIYSFRDNFEKYKDENIVLYGTGEYAKRIITNFKDYNILGMLDRWSSYGQIWEKPIFSYKEILEKKVNVIIIAASQYNTETVCKRIGKFCSDNEINVFSLEGELLNNRVSEELNEKYSDNRLGRYYECKKLIKP